MMAENYGNVIVQYLPGQQTGDIFRSMDSLVLRHPITCMEFNGRSCNSVV
jgi:hypothetical protein